MTTPDNMKKIFSANELVIRKVNRTEWLIGSLIPKNSIVILGGDSGTGKTILSIVCALCAGTNTAVLDKFKSKNNVRTLIYDEENQKDVTTLRIKSLIKGHGFELHEDNVFFSITAGVTFSKKHLQQIEKDIETYKPNLIVLDSLVRFIEGNEDKSGDMKKVFDIIKPLIKKHNVSFLLLHHTVKGSKGSKHDLRGSGDLTAFADLVFMLQKQKFCGKDLFILKQVKNRLGQEIPGVGYNVNKKVDADDTVIESKFILNKMYDDKLDLSLMEAQEEILLWTLSRKEKEFKTKELNEHLTKKEITETRLIHAAINQLINLKFIERVKKGTYRILDNDNVNTI